MKANDALGQDAGLWKPKQSSHEDRWPRHLTCLLEDKKLQPMPTLRDYCELMEDLSQKTSKESFCTINKSLVHHFNKDILEKFYPDLTHSNLFWFTNV